MQDKFLRHAESHDAAFATAQDDSLLGETGLADGLAEDLPTMCDVLWDIGVALAAFAALAVAANIFVLVT
jgi:hypothetical protein